MKDEKLLTVLLSPCEPDDSVEYFNDTLTALTHSLDQGRSKHMIEKQIECDVMEEQRELAREKLLHVD